MRSKAKVLFLMATFACGALQAQTTTGSVVGLVTDGTNATISSATVTLTNTETADRHAAETDGNGGYQFLVLPPGYYRLEVEKPGFKRFVRDRPALLEHDDPAHEVERIVAGMRDQDERCLGGIEERPQEIAHLGAFLVVKAGEWFVHEDEFGLLRQRPSQRDPLPFATREFIESRVGSMSEAHAIEQAPGQFDAAAASPL